MEIPPWAWGLFLSLIALFGSAITATLLYYAKRLDLRLDNHDKRIGKAEVAIARVEARL